MNNLTLWAGHIEYNSPGKFRGRGSLDHLKQIFENAIIGWLPNGDNDPSRASGQIRSFDGLTILETASWTGAKWEWNK